MSEAVPEQQEKVVMGDVLDVLRPYLNENIVGVNVSEEAYLAKYADRHYEWVEGILIQMSPISDAHQEIDDYLVMLLRAYFEHRPIGRVRHEPFTMKIGKSYRQPALQIIFNENPHYTETGMQGPADICVEIVSPESVQRDYETKFADYAQFGVLEYWLIDLREDVKQAKFHRLTNNQYIEVKLDADQSYTTPLLPGLKLHVPTLWQEELPTISAIVKYVADMFATD